MISVTLRGRLGNQMFQYVVCRIVAENNNYEWSIIEGDSEEKLYFNMPPEKFKWLGSKLFNLDMGVKYPKIENIYKEKKNQKYDPNIFNIYDFTEIVGYFQTEKYFKSNKDKVKEWFKIKYKSDNVSNILKKYPVDEYCYIHFRGGDYTRNKSLLPPEYYNVAKNKMNMKCVIITDDVEFAKRYFKNDIILSNTLEDDFTILTESKFMILSASSFSWWTAWLKDKEKVVGPQGWFNYKSSFFMPEDIKLKKIIYI